MSDPFFAKKRKRNAGPVGRSSRGRMADARLPARVPRLVNEVAEEDDEEITDPESSEDEDMQDVGDSSSTSQENTDEDSETESLNEDEINESAADKRRRLAQQYLDNLQSEIDQSTGFDGRDVDKDILAARLNQDVAEDQGKLYKFIARQFSCKQPIRQFMSYKAMLSATGVAVSQTHVFAISKDRILSKFDLTTGKRIKYVRGFHDKEILCISISSDGKFVVTGGGDHKINVFDAESLEHLRTFTQHRDAVLGLVFRRGTHTLYSSSADRTVKSWSIDGLAYVETLFGHQDAISDIASLAEERCITAGSRDRTIRLWKIVEESQLIFRGVGMGSDNKRSGFVTIGDTASKRFAEGSIDHVAIVDRHIFVSGSDNGSISLWTLAKKKPVFVVPLAHGFDTPLSGSQWSAEQNTTALQTPSPSPRWITALYAVPYSDMILSGSWSGSVKIWQVVIDEIERLDDSGVATGSLRKNYRLQLVGELRISGVINGIEVLEATADELKVCLAIGTEITGGRWIRHEARHGIQVLTLRRKDVDVDVLSE
ncbi:WD40-repeat-containing domain protein [Lipomyces oligophaga]|uniref:WD40-repeat-containing domain protein n=1 Tax=Lipomyces oligophaga TaxID=45792 RepID=UPI0034CD1A02